MRLVRAIDDEPVGHAADERLACARERGHVRRGSTAREDAGREGWIIVTRDVNTLLGELVSLCDEGAPMPGFAVVASERLADIGWIARKLAAMEKKFVRVKACNVQVFL